MLPKSPTRLPGSIEPTTPQADIRPDGLRYSTRPNTSPPFPGAPGATISCLLCGRHVPRSSLRPFLLAGNRQYRCRDGCHPAQD